MIVNIGDIRMKKFIQAKSFELENADDGRVLTVPISSVSEDRDGDSFSEKGLKSMVEQLKEGTVPLFLDHGLSVETGFQEYRTSDIIGKWVDGEVRDGEVYGSVELREDDERVDELVSLIEQDMPVGFSVGFQPVDYQEGEHGLIFDEIDLFETSAVGVPANPDAVTAGLAIAKGLSEKNVLGKDFDADRFVKMFEKALKDNDISGVDTMSNEENEDVDVSEQKEKEEQEEQDVQDEGQKEQLDVDEVADKLVDKIDLQISKKVEQKLLARFKEFDDDEVQEIMGILGGHFRDLFESVMSAYRGAEDDEEFSAMLDSILDSVSEGIQEDLENGDNGDNDEESGYEDDEDKEDDDDVGYEEDSVDEDKKVSDPVGKRITTVSSETKENEDVEEVSGKKDTDVSVFDSYY